ncbi:hypothetical protein E1263_08210 [Kribbella antibiotica]|uniref:Uncharacterized protein n=1 Tax=Kribbella antibiotica TaxID=190195 RepID=A0A4R4ZQC9_9ACTN|nr:hypothetical protein [Kribbella antibiotica]TDD61161.1 hypothetical protein E1263_08210 [Kribbella antibiotica]
MNLTTPPPVEQLDPEYTETLRRNVVRGAYKAFRPKPPRWTPFLAWVPVVAATAAVAIGITSVVTLSRSGDPAGSTGIQQESPDKTQREWLDLGDASDSQARAAARQCLKLKTTVSGTTEDLYGPADADAATIRSARWIKAFGVPGKSRQLLQTFVTANSNFWFQCLDGEILRWDTSAAAANEQNPIPGTWAWNNVGEGKSAGVRASYSFRAAKNVGLVELRIRGLNGVSPWYADVTVDQAGYLEGILPDAVAEHGNAEIDVRAFDKDGKQVFFTTFG